MAVTILRKTGIFGPWGQLKLIVKEDEAAKIANNQTVTFDLPSYPIHLSIKGDPKSTILVSDHQKYILCTNPLFQWACLTAISLFIISIFIKIVLIKWILLIIYMTLLLVAQFFLPRYCFKPMLAPRIKIKEFC
ncbi:hypothetical protein BN1356_01250 [Streptococcus varani]|uniref:Uncharacterized protein n=1 Tax=Streptococcus varani TaxID=1608583 RepID=A0A0E3WF55_9STRE|nr:hypothetical protein [Streptococcus varani]CQR24898.1 hypothetical protein BN1356_01250 [Streptococcus varani]